MDIETLIAEITNQVCVRLDAAAAGSDGDAVRGFSDGAAHERAQGSAASADRLAGTLELMLTGEAVTEEETAEACQAAASAHCQSVSVYSGLTAVAAKQLQGTDVKVCALVGWPHGAASASAKAAEALDAVMNGAGEIEAAMNFGLLRSRKWKDAAEDLKTVIAAVGGRVPVRAAAGACFMSEAELVKACAVAKAAGAESVSVYTASGNMSDAVRRTAVARSTLGAGVEIKAGVVSDMSDVPRLREAGAARIGACPQALKSF